MSALAWGRVLRLSLAPSALADVAAGVVIGGWGDASALREAWPLLLASACVYHGGMALNDWADRVHDARTRAQRPIPSGALSANAVLAAGAVLITVAVLCASVVSLEVGAWTGALATLVLAYDLGSRGPWVGPALLAACRAANLALGVLYASSLAPLPPTWFAAPLLYGAYVFCASRIARLEDVSQAPNAARGPRSAAFAAAGLLLASAFVDVRQANALGFDAIALAAAAAGAFGLARAAWTTREWSAAACGAFTGMALRRLLVFTAVLTLAQRGESWDALLVGAAILAGFPLSTALRRVFPPT